MRELVTVMACYVGFILVAYFGVILAMGLAKTLGVG